MNMGMIIYIYLFIFNFTYVSLLETKVDICADDYLKGVFLNDVKVDSLNEGEKEVGLYNGTVSNFQALPGDTLGILINNYGMSMGYQPL